MGSNEKRQSVPNLEAQLAATIVEDLITKGIKLLALDFDKTIVSVHTAGYWKQGTPKLADHVRPCFTALIQAALESPLHVCVVTYSMQPLLIRDVLKLVLPKSDIERIIVRANSKEWLPTQPTGPGQSLGKQQHIAWICTEIFNHKHVIVESHEILLMDDDEENVQLARDFGHQAYQVLEDVTLQDLHHYVEQLVVHKVAPCTVTP